MKNDWKIIFPAQDDNGKETSVINQPANPTGVNGVNKDGFCRTLRFIRCLLFNWSFLVLVAFLLNLPVGTPILAQDKPAIVPEVATTPVGVERPVTKVEKVSGDEKRDDKADEKKIASAELMQPVTRQTPAPQATPEPTPTASELANQINNPAAPVTFIQFRNILVPNIPGTGGATNAFQIQPVIPIFPSHSLPFLQLIKMTLPVVSLPSPVSRAGLGDLQFFDLVSIKQSWGRWGFGPALVFPTATSKALGAGKWQAGPSFALIPISFAGDSTRSAVNNLIITPTFTYNIPGHLIPGSLVLGLVTAATAFWVG